MIFEAIVAVFVGIVTFIGDLFPDMDTPGWVSGLAGQVAQVTGEMASLGVWLPFSAAGNATMLVVTALGVALVVKFVRLVLSLLTGGGGGAA